MIADCSAVYHLKKKAIHAVPKQVLVRHPKYIPYVGHPRFPSSESFCMFVDYTCSKNFCLCMCIAQQCLVCQCKSSPQGDPPNSQLVAIYLLYIDLMIAISYCSIIQEKKKNPILQQFLNATISGSKQSARSKQTQHCKNFQ